MSQRALNIVITCGPAYEPIDQARRITNFSTGRLGAVLANAFVAAGHEVFCLRGEGATYSGAIKARWLKSFSTNEDLSGQLQTLAKAERIDVVLHAAALCDFRVERVLNERDEVLTSPKFSTRSGQIKLILAPATKVLPQLRDWFPSARIVGWKYELEGGQTAAFAKAWQQLAEARTDGCVLNGAAYGPGFAFCTPPAQVECCSDAENLGKILLDWLGNRVE